jgi:hypothetical protein
LRQGKSLGKTDRLMVWQITKRHSGRTTTSVCNWSSRVEWRAFGGPLHRDFDRGFLIVRSLAGLDK